MVMEHCGNPNGELALYLNQVRPDHRFEDIELFDDVLPVLTALKGKYTIGLPSNGNSCPGRCGLEDMFEFVIFSQDYGIEKPDPHLFEIAVKKAKCSKNELIHVDDSLENNIVGAVNAGIPCVWLNRKGVKNDLNITVEYEISSLVELFEILG